MFIDRSCLETKLEQVQKGDQSGEQPHSDACCLVRGDQERLTDPQGRRHITVQSLAGLLTDTFVKIGQEYAELGEAFAGLSSEENRDVF